MSLKAKIEAIIYATEEPVTLDQLASLLKDAALAELQAEENARLALNETIYDGRSAAEESADDSPQREASSAEQSASPEQGQRPTADHSSEEQDKDRLKQELREVKS